MWLFQSQRERVREVALKIIKGLADGTLVPDPPLAADPPMDFGAAEASLREPSTGSAAERLYRLLVPLGDRIVVEPLEVEMPTAGGILLPDAAKPKPQRGRVLAVGRGKLLEDGKRVPLEIAEGDEVLYGQYAGDDVKVGTKDVKILHESDILAKFVK